MATSREANMKTTGDYCEGDVRPEHIYTLAQLEALGTLTVGQADDLKLQDGNFNIWLSRCGIEDGEPCDNKVTIEERQDGRWVEVGWYEAV
jgi:hypothetical protein